MKFLFLVMFFSQSLPDVLDNRQCGDVLRGKNGKILRSSALLRNFKKIYPCPSTMKSIGRCPDWQIDHVIPLACGGCDNIENLQWLPKAIKTAKGKVAKDRWERKLYCNFTKPIELE